MCAVHVLRGKQEDRFEKTGEGSDLWRQILVWGCVKGRELKIGHKMMKMKRCEKERRQESLLKSGGCSVAVDREDWAETEQVGMLKWKRDNSWWVIGLDCPAMQQVDWYLRMCFYVTNGWLSCLFTCRNIDGKVGKCPREQRLWVC